MTSPTRFDRRHGKGAFLRLCAMLNDSRFAYQQIANKFGFTRQYTARLAKQLEVNGHQRRRQRERLRMLHREPRVIKEDYPAGIQAVIDKIKRRGIPVAPYVFPAQPSALYLARRSQTMALVNGRLCTIQFRKSRKLTPNGREYVRFDNNVRVRKADFALWAMRSGRAIKVYVVPLTHLRNVSAVYLPVEGNYVYRGRKPRKDWTRYERAWHLLRRKVHT
jgi:hypothetical protein